MHARTYSPQIGGTVSLEVMCSLLYLAGAGDQLLLLIGDAMIIERAKVS